MSTTEAIVEKLNALPPEQREDVLEFVDALIMRTAAKTGEPYSALRTAASLNLDGPPDWSKRFHEYLYGENARDGK